MHLTLLDFLLPQDDESSTLERVFAIGAACTGAASLLMLTSIR